MEGHSQRVAQLQLDVRIGGELARVEPLRRIEEQVGHLDLLAQRFERVRVGQDAREEVARGDGARAGDVGLDRAQIGQPALLDRGLAALDGQPALLVGEHALLHRERALLVGAQEPDRRADRAGDQREHDEARREHGDAVARDELAHEVGAARRRRGDRLVRQVALDVAREALGGLVAALAVALDRLHHDPVEVAAQARGEDARAKRRGARRRSSPPRRGRRSACSAAACSRNARCISGNEARSNGQRAGEQLVQHHAQRVEVAAGVGLAALDRRAPGTRIPACPRNAPGR